MQNVRKRSVLRVFAACNVHERLQQWNERHNACREKNVLDLPIEESIFLAPEYGVFLDFFYFLHKTVSKRYTEVSIFADFADDSYFCVQSPDEF